MKIYKIFYLIILFVPISIAFNYQNEKPVMKPDIYNYTYISMLSGGDSIAFHYWNKARFENHIGGLRFKVINDSLIYRLHKNNDTTFFKRLNSRRLLYYKPLPKQYLDYKLIGAFTANNAPGDYFFVFYYSEKRNSLMEQNHEFELNRIIGITIYQNTPKNPFANYKQYFKIWTGGNTYYYNVTPREIDSLLKLKKEIILNKSGGNTF